MSSDLTRRVHSSAKFDFPTVRSPDDSGTLRRVDPTAGIGNVYTAGGTVSFGITNATELVDMKSAYLTYEIVIAQTNVNAQAMYLSRAPNEWESGTVFFNGTQLQAVTSDLGNVTYNHAIHTDPMQYATIVDAVGISEPPAHIAFGQMQIGRESHSRMGRPASTMAVVSGTPSYFQVSIPLRYMLSSFYSEYLPVELFCGCQTLRVDLLVTSAIRKFTWFGADPGGAGGGDTAAFTIINPQIWYKTFKPCPAYVEALNMRFENPETPLGDHTIPAIRIPYLNEAIFKTEQQKGTPGVQINIDISAVSVRAVMIWARRSDTAAGYDQDFAYGDWIRKHGFYMMAGQTQIPSQPISGAGYTVPYRGVENAIRVLAQNGAGQMYRGQDRLTYSVPPRSNFLDQGVDYFTTTGVQSTSFILIDLTAHNAVYGDGKSEDAVGFVDGMPLNCRLVANMITDLPTDVSVTWYSQVVYNSVIDVSKANGVIRLENL